MSPSASRRNAWIYPTASRRNLWIFNITTVGLLALLVWVVGVWYGMAVYAVLFFGTWGVLWMARRNLRG